MFQNAPAVSERFINYGGLFVGNISAEVFGDYGVGPNHTLPTAGTARYAGGLSVFNFLRIRTFLELDESATGALAQQQHDLVADSAALARLEGLEGHARSAERRYEVIATAGGAASTSKVATS
jgi:phosphoribosyl-ATP pyrophosphohydrolase/phosphoribosyl-AMP cyclohydrolase/histidinol dehydrogenase